MKNLNNHTKSELIALLESNKIDKSKRIDENKKQSSITIWDIFHKIKFWILSLSLITILSKIFKKYKSIRAILRIANYIIITMFGISLLDAFGLGFLAKFLGELKYVFGAVIAYLTDSTFYNYLMKMFNVTEEKQSIRDLYKKPVETDWKAEYEKAERKREWEKWLEKHGKHKHEGEIIDTKTIILTILFLGGTIAVWYYGKEALDLISPVWNVSNMIRRILRGGDDDDNLPPTPTESSRNQNIELVPDNRSPSPEMLVYSSDMVEKQVIDKLPPGHPAKFDNTVPPAPPAPPIFEAPIPSTEKGAPTGLMDAIKSKILKPTETIVKDSTPQGRILEEDNNATASSSKVKIDTPTTKKSGILEALSNKFDKINQIEKEEIQGSEEWDESGNTTPTNIKKGKKKFLEAIKKEESSVVNPKISGVLDSIKQNFPYLSEKTLEKLSTKEGIENRAEIINSIPDNELFPLKKLTDFSNKDQERISEIINSTSNLKSTVVVDLIKQEFPEYDDSTYRQSFINATKEEISSGKTELKRKNIEKIILDADLTEIECIKNKTDLNSLKNAINENYTVGSIMSEIKSKVNRTELEELIDKGKIVENLTDLDDITLLKLENVAANTNPDVLLSKLLELPTQGDNSYINDLLDKSIAYNLDKIIKENPGLRKHQLIEKLFEQNPEQIDKISYFMRETYNNNIDVISSKIDSNQNKKNNK